MIDFAPLTDRVGDAGAAAVVGALLGLGFGFLAQRSRFCLRSAALEIRQNKFGPALAVWLSAFGAAIFAIQYLIAAGGLDPTSIRRLGEPTSLSGAVVGGLLFGIGMILSRGCSSRHLVLAASGNLRAVAVFAVFAVTALATISGPLAPLGRAVSGLWRIPAAQADLIANLGGGTSAGMLLGLALLAASVIIFIINRASYWLLAGGLLIGLIAAAGWSLTSGLSTHTFEPTKVESIAFTAPAANSLLYLSALGARALSFDIGFIPAVVAGALIASVVFGEFRLQWFENWGSTARYLIGAVLMGFGGVTAVGCAVGNLANASVMMTTAWAALGAIWLGAMAMDFAQQKVGRLGPLISPARRTIEA